MKKVLAISSVLLGVVFLAGCGQQPVSQTQPTTPAPIVKQPATTPPVATQPAPTTPAVTQNYIEVKELGFKIPVDASSANEITYKITQVTKDSPTPGVYFSTKELNSMSKDCEEGSIGAISKVSGKVSTDPNSENFMPGEIKQLQGFSLVFQTPQAPCHSGDNSLDRKFMQILETGFKNAVLLGQ
ncbi:MAG: hypothetical protein WCK16_00870 [Candidatus Moraniibacteriota bacterium]